jgi:hypothetical protein
MRELRPQPIRHVSLCEALDSVLNTGVVALGEVTLSVADVDLIYLGLQLVVTSIESGGQSSPAISRPELGPDASAGPRPAPIEVRPRGQPETRPSADVLPVAPGGRPDSQSSRASGENTELIGNAIARPGCKPEKNGLGQLVLTLIKLLHELLKRQALRRIEGGALTPAQIERLGVTLMNQAREIDHLRDDLGLMDKDLNLDLGPLGKLL